LDSVQFRQLLSNLNDYQPNLRLVTIFEKEEENGKQKKPNNKRYRRKANQTRLANEQIMSLQNHLRNDVSSLTEVSLACCELGPTGTAILCECLFTNHFLRVLDLQENELGLHGATCVAALLVSNCSITDLNLENNRIGDDGVRFLCEALRCNVCLEKFNLESNEFGDTGAGYISWLLNGHNISLSTIRIGFNDIGERGVESLVKALENNTFVRELDLGERAYPDDLMVKYWKRIKRNREIAEFSKAQPNSIPMLESENRIEYHRSDTVSELNTIHTTKGSKSFLSMIGCSFGHE